MPSFRQVLTKVTDTAVAEVGASIDRRLGRASGREPSVVKNPNEVNPIGPHAALETTQYSTTDLRYPQDLGSNSPERLHYVKFLINTRSPSRYSSQETSDIGVVDQNRAGENQVSSGDAFNAFGKTALVTGGGVTGLVRGAIAGIVGGSRGIVTGAIAGAVFGGTIGTIISQVNLQRKTKRISSVISLYMPDTINQQIVHQFGEISMTDAMGMAGLISQGGEAVGESIGSAIMNMDPSQLKGAGVVTKEAAGQIAEGSGFFGPGLSQALLFSAGRARNPQVEVLYQQTSHREFMFDFRLTPRNKAESGTIRDIIKKFKEHAAPELSPEGGRYLIPPDDFDIEFWYGNNKNENIHKISSCALVGIDVNYASAGQWATFGDGMPVQTSLQLRFKELELIHRQRVQDGY